MTPSEISVPYGFCHCGCGEKTRIAPKTNTRDRSVKGQPLLYFRGHSRRKAPFPYTVSHTGYKTPCWLWQWNVRDDGYGRASDGSGGSRSAHKLYWENVNGLVPHGLELDHLCRIRHCVNPDHLEPVTRAEHVKRSHPRQFVEQRRALRTHCPKGHEFTQGNTILKSSVAKCKIPRRACRACENAYQRKQHALKKKREVQG